MSEKKKEAAGAQVAPAMGPPALINKEDIPQVLPILPLRNSVFFPGGVLPLAVGRQKTIALIKDLDTRMSAEIMDLFVSLNSESNITVIIITHEPDIAAYSRRIIRFLDGCIVSDEVKKEPSDRAVV